MGMILVVLNLALCAVAIGHHLRRRRKQQVLEAHARAERAAPMNPDRSADDAAPPRRSDRARRTSPRRQPTLNELRGRHRRWVAEALALPEPDACRLRPSTRFDVAQFYPGPAHPAGLTNEVLSMDGLHWVKLIMALTKRYAVEPDDDLLEAMPSWTLGQVLCWFHLASERATTRA